MEGSGWREACSFLVAKPPCVHGIDFAVVVLAELRSCPSVVVEFRIEQVVAGNAHACFLESQLLEAEVVAQVKVCGEVVFQHERLVR